MANPTVSLNLDDLRRATNLLLEYAFTRHGKNLNLEKAHFWSVSVGDSFDMTSQPELTIGNIEESWQHLTEMLVDNSRVVGYGLVWLAEVLRAIGDETP